MNLEAYMEAFYFDEKPDEEDGGENADSESLREDELPDEVKARFGDFILRFSKLSLFDKLLITFLLTEKKDDFRRGARYSQVDFAKGVWIDLLPPEFLEHFTIDRSRRISKQAVNSRLKRILTKIPELRIFAPGGMEPQEPLTGTGEID